MKKKEIKQKMKELKDSGKLDGLSRKQIRCLKKIYKFKLDVIITKN